ncbi:MAG: L,D-transpeptidase family protein [Lachnospiraceae bacterium]
MAILNTNGKTKKNKRKNVPTKAAVQEGQVDSSIERAMAQIVDESTRNLQAPVAGSGTGRKAKKREEANVEKSGKKKIIAFSVVGVLLVLLATGYILAANYYSTHFFRGTTINGLDTSDLTVAEAENKVADSVEKYRILVESRNLEDQYIEGASIDYSYVSDGGIEKIKNEQEHWKWIASFFEKHEYTTDENITFNQEKLSTVVQALEAAQEENQVAPTDAQLVYQNNEFEIVAEDNGATLDVEKAIEVIAAAVSKSETKVSLDEQGAYVNPVVGAADTALNAAKDAYNQYAAASITYQFGDQTEVLDGNTIKNWMLSDTGELAYDEDVFASKIAEFVADLASRHDTVSKVRSFTATTDGRTVEVPSGSYGWKINQSAEVETLTTEIYAGSVVEREPTYSSRANAYGDNDIGTSYIEVDLTNQIMYVYNEGQLVLQSLIVSGKASDPSRITPGGVFRLSYKQSPAVLRGTRYADGTYSYQQPVTYWMPFNGDIGFHDATWNPSFGGTRYINNGSHGCINMPFDEAQALYSLINKDYPILCFY